MGSTGIPTTEAVLIDFSADELPSPVPSVISNTSRKQGHVSSSSSILDEPIDIAEESGKNYNIAFL